MADKLTVDNLFDRLRDKLCLSWIAARQGGSRPIRSQIDEETGTISFIGHLNFVHPYRIQVVGRIELRYLETLDEEARRSALGRLFSADTDTVILAEGQPVPEDIKRRAEAASIPLLLSCLPSHELISHLQYFYVHNYAERMTLHGVFMEVMGIGVLIMGDPSIGKSELALELVSRGHRLIADDSPEFARVAPDLLVGTCPEILRNFIEVRGLGVLNIRAMFGDAAVKYSKYLRLIVRLIRMPEQELNRIDRLKGSRLTRNLFGVDVPEIRLPVAPGRNLAVLVEAAARNQILLTRGYDAGASFIEQQQQRISDTGE